MAETIKVKGNESQGGFVNINKADFDEDVHELYVEGKAVKEKAVSEMTKPELIVFAEANEFSIDPTENKPEVLAAVLAAIEAKLEASAE